MVITESHIAVIDGSTSKTTFRFDPEVTNGRFAMQTVAAFIGRMNRDITCEEFCERITLHFHDIYEEHGMTDEMQNHPECRPTCSAVIYSDYHRQVWMIGDCQCIIDGRYYDNPKPIEERNAAIRSEYLQKLLSHGNISIDDIRSNDIGRKQITEGLFESTRQQNKTFSVIDGTPILTEKVVVIDIDEKEDGNTSHEIILASDGYPFLRPTLEESEARLKTLLSDDPLLIRDFKATKAWMAGNKSFDDRTYIRAHISTR